MNKLIAISIICLLSFGSVTKSLGQSGSSDLTEAQVDSVFLKMVNAADRLDFKELSSGVDDTRAAGFIADGKYYPSYSSLVKEVESLSQGINRQSVSLKQKKITVLSDTIALITASGVSKSYLDDGREIDVKFQWSFLYEKKDNDWVVIHSHQSATR